MKILKVCLLTIMLFFFSLAKSQNNTILTLSSSQGNVLDPAITNADYITTCSGSPVKFRPLFSSNISDNFADIQAQKTQEIYDTYGYNNVTELSFNVNYTMKVITDNATSQSANGTVTIHWINGLNASTPLDYDFDSSNGSIESDSYPLITNETFPDISFTFTNSPYLCGNNEFSLTYQDTGGSIYIGDILVKLQFTYTYSFVVKDESYSATENASVDIMFANAFSGRDRITIIPEDHGINMSTNLPELIPCYKNESLSILTSIGPCMNPYTQDLIWEVIQGDATISNPSSNNATLSVSKGSEEIIIKLTSTLADVYLLDCNIYEKYFTIERGEISAILVDQNNIEPDESQCLNVEETYEFVYQLDGNPIANNDVSFFSNTLSNYPNPTVLNVSRNRNYISFNAHFVDASYSVPFEISAEGCQTAYYDYTFTTGSEPEIINDCSELHPGYGKAFITLPQEYTDLFFFDNFNDLYATHIFTTSNSAFIAESNNFPWSLYLDVYEYCFDNTTQYVESYSYDYFESDCGIRTSRRKLIADPMLYSKVIVKNKFSELSDEIPLNEFYLENIDSYGENIQIILVGNDGDLYNYEPDSNKISILSSNIDNGLGLNIYPNPINQDAKIMFNLIEKSNVTIKIIDLSGKLLKSEYFMDYNIGSHSLDLKLSDLKNGIYIINIATQNLNESKRITISK